MFVLNGGWFPTSPEQKARLYRHGAKLTSSSPYA